MNELHATIAWAIIDAEGHYFAGFVDPRKNPDVKVKWRTGLCDAHLFGGKMRTQAEKYIERIKGKGDTHVMRVVRVTLDSGQENDQ